MYLTSRNQNIDIYFGEIRSNYSELTREDEINLFTRIANGDKKAGEEVFNRMAKMAVAIAKTYTGDANLLEDLIQEANIGILTAIDKYDVNAGFRFSTYARWWMKANINLFLDNMGVVHHVNPKLVNIVKKIKEDFYSENNRDITDIELMEKLEDMGEFVSDVSSFNISITSIDVNIDEDNELTVGDYGDYAEATASHNTYEDDVENDNIANEVEVRMRVLDSRERMFVRMKFGLIDGNEMEYSSIADEWNQNNPDKKLTAERVRQIVTNAIKKMK